MFTYLSARPFRNILHVGGAADKLYGYTQRNMLTGAHKRLSMKIFLFTQQLKIFRKIILYRARVSVTIKNTINFCVQKHTLQTFCAIALYRNVNQMISLCTPRYDFITNSINFLVSSNKCYKYNTTNIYVILI